jgi:ribosome recycling factor
MTGMLEATFDEARQHMDGCIDGLRKELATLRTGKASPRLLDAIQVAAYGSKMPLNQLATISAPEARLLTVSPFDKSQIGAIEKAILVSDLGITPTNDGNIIRLPVPSLNEERRREYVKLAKKYGEDAKVHVRGVRRDANDRLKKAQGASEITEDDLHRGQDRVQKLTDEFISEVDRIIEAKEKEIMEV